MSTSSEEFLARYFASEHISHFICGAEKRMIVLTDKKTFFTFFQPKSIVQSLWLFVDRAIAFKIVLALNPGKMNAATDFSPKMPTDLNECLELQLFDLIPIKQTKKGEKQIKRNKYKKEQVLWQSCYMN